MHTDQFYGRFWQKPSGHFESRSILRSVLSLHFKMFNIKFKMFKIKMFSLEFKMFKSNMFKLKMFNIKKFNLHFKMFWISKYTIGYPLVKYCSISLHNLEKAFNTPTLCLQSCTILRQPFEHFKKFEIIVLDFRETFRTLETWWTGVKLPCEVALLKHKENSKWSITIFSWIGNVSSLPFLNPNPESFFDYFVIM